MADIHVLNGADGERFLMLKQGAVSESGTVRQPRVVIVENWVEQLERLVPTQ